jgi:hypothetical protein
LAFKIALIAAPSVAMFAMEGHQQPIDLVWLWFRTPHVGRPAGNADF